MGVSSSFPVIQGLRFAARQQPLEARGESGNCLRKALEAFVVHASRPARDDALRDAPPAPVPYGAQVAYPASNSGSSQSSRLPDGGSVLASLDISTAPWHF